MTDLDRRLAELGITAEHLSSCALPRYKEAAELIDAGLDMFDRPQKMTAAANEAWQLMRQAAAGDGVELKLVSAYRSVDYQCELIQAKLADGRSIDDILKVNAIPGHSEHHTGCALDLHCGDGDPLTEDFETTVAFSWLSNNAHRFGFRLSYPRDNAEGIDYEPWHWCFSNPV